MKITKFILPTTVLCIVCTSAIFAQDCSKFFPFEKGATLEYSNYDEKDKFLSSFSQKVILVDNTAKDSIVAQVEMQFNDKKGKEAMKSNYNITCKKDTLYMDIAATMPQLTEAFSSMEVTVTGKELQIPSILSVGQALPDANMEIQAASRGLNLLTMSIDVVDRKVEGKESVTTPAGTFDCFKISQTTNTKMLVGKTFHSVYWYAEKVGMVKSENYDKKGDLESYMLLTKFSKE